LIATPVGEPLKLTGRVSCISDGENHVTLMHQFRNTSESGRRDGLFASYFT
jgi:hypothetical protein